MTINPADLFAGGGEMGAIMRSTDWSRTKLGPVEHWPKSLRTMLGVILGSRFPMLLWWGPDLLHLYNDAYRPILRDKRPASLAAPAAQVWAEVWEVAGPMARSVQEGGPATWTEDLQLFFTSGKMAEETYFTFSYSPVPGDDGRVGGLLNTVFETTAKVQSERQIRMLHDLSARAADAKSEDEAYRIAIEVLSANELDLPFALLYVLEEKADDARLAGVSGWKEYEGPAKLAQVSIGGNGSTAHWPLAEVMRTGRELVIDDLAGRFGALPTGRWKRSEALAEIDRAKTAFFSNVSHDRDCGRIHPGGRRQRSGRGQRVMNSATNRSCAARLHRLGTSPRLGRRWAAAARTVQPRCRPSTRSRRPGRLHRTG